jgi:hypothetical protein
MTERSEIVLSVCRALLGEVFPKLRLVSCSSDAQKICVDFYVDGPIDEVDADSVSCVETSLIADWHGLKEVVVRTYEVRLGTPVPGTDGSVAVFRRRE